MATTDQKLVNGTLAGNTDAFGELVERYSGLVHGVVLEVVRRPEEVEDLVQEVFCKAYEELPRLRRPSRFAPWLAQIAHSMVLRWLRQKKVRRRSEGELDKVVLLSPLPLPDEDLESSERTDLLWDALNRLDPEHRQLLVLYHMEGCTFKEIARFVGKPLATVRWRLLKSERKLGQHLGVVLGHRKHTPVQKRKLAKKVLSTLPPALYLASASRAYPWWHFRSWPLTPAHLLRRGGGRPHGRVPVGGRFFLRGRKSAVPGGDVRSPAPRSRRRSALHPAFPLAPGVSCLL